MPPGPTATYFLKENQCEVACRFCNVFFKLGKGSTSSGSNLCRSASCHSGHFLQRRHLVLLSRVIHTAIDTERCFLSERFYNY